MSGSIEDEEYDEMRRYRKKHRDEYEDDREIDDENYRGEMSSGRYRDRYGDKYEDRKKRNARMVIGTDMDTEEPDEKPELDAEPELDPEPELESEPEPKYTLKKLEDIMKSKGYHIDHEFVLDNNIIFIRVIVESTGDKILVYFPSKYSISHDENRGINRQWTKLNQYEEDESETINISGDEDYKEIELGAVKSLDISDANYEEIKIDGEKNRKIRKYINQHISQLENFKRCTVNIPYKFSILTNSTLCVINRHNDTESYILDRDVDIIEELYDPKTKKTEKILQEFYVTIDLKNFYEKMTTLSSDIININKDFYNKINEIHTKRIVKIGNVFSTYQNMIHRMIQSHSNNKFHSVISNLTDTIQLANVKEKSILSRNMPSSISTIDLKKISQAREQSIKMLNDVKLKYHSHMIQLDYIIGEITKNTKELENTIKICI